MLVVDPRRRRHGWGSATLRSVVAHPDLRHTRIFSGDVEADNVASIRLVERAGFVLRSPEPDFEGMLH